MSYDVLRDLKTKNYRKKTNKKQQRQTKEINKRCEDDNIMRVECEEITCSLDEKFVPFETDGKCMICQKNTATKISEHYLDIYIEYNNGGGCDAVLLGICDSCFQKHTEKVLSARNNKESCIVYYINH